MIELTVQGITTLAEAELLIDNAQRDRRQKNHSAEAIDMNSETAEEKALRTQQELEVAQAELASSNAIIAALPEGKTKEAEITKKLGLELKIRKLTSTASSTGIVSVLEKELQLAQLNAEIVVLDDYISQITARKAQL
jgi:hypothetical protein